MISMRANYISHFRKNNETGQSKLACQIETVACTADTVVNVKKASGPKIRREKTMVCTAEVSELFPQYRLDL